jgi:hypothetical protein
MNKTVLTITLSEDGRVELNGPLQDRLLCYGLLETAKEIVSKAGQVEFERKPQITVARSASFLQQAARAPLPPQNGNA